MESDEYEDGVAQTNDLCTEGKYAAVLRGYYIDPFIEVFKNGTLMPVGARGGGKCNKLRPHPNPLPIMNRGYYARVTTVRACLQAFLFQKRGMQVVSLGAGYDTSYFYLKSIGLSIDKYVEVDLPQVVSHKGAIIKKHQTSHFGPYLPQVSFKTNNEITSRYYHLISADIRKTEHLIKRLTQIGLDFDASTLFLSECVLIYMSTTESSGIISWASDAFKNSYFMVHEQIRPEDAFGRIMVQNIQSQGPPLKSLFDHSTLNDQIQRFLKHSWEHCEARDMLDVYENVITINPAEARRIHRLELLDEVEEWRLLCQHYSFVLASHHSNLQIDAKNTNGIYLTFNDLKQVLQSPSNPKTRDPKESLLL